MIDVKMTKIKNGEALRTESVKGQTNVFPPEEDRPFKMMAEGLEFGTRFVWTSPVDNVKKESEESFLIETQNSTYRIESIDSKESGETNG